MKILFVSQYYPPDIGAGANRICDFAEGLVRLGHEVWVVTAFPHYPKGIIPKEYKFKFVSKEQKNSVNVVRMFIYANPSRSFFHRMLNYLSFMITAPLGVLLTKGKFDVCIVSPPPPFHLFSVYPLKFFKFRRFVIDIRDLWPESVVAYGVMRENFIIKILGNLIHWIYKKSDWIITATYGQEKYLREHGLKKISTIPNGWRKIAKKERIEKEYKLSKLKLRNNEKIAVYIGTIGLAFDFFPVLEAIKNQKDWKLLMIGEGPLKEEISKFCKTNKINNVYLLPTMHFEDLTEYLKIADVGILPIKKTTIFYQSLPSKLFDYLWANLFVAGSISYSMKVLFKRIKFKDWKEIESSEEWKKFFKTFKRREKTKKYDFKILNAEERVKKLLSILDKVGEVNKSRNSS